MQQQYALDLRVARRKAGLTQVDCGHLLGIDPSRITKFESGSRRPSFVELSILCLVLNTSPARFSEEIVRAHAAVLHKRLGSMPRCPANWRARANRLNTLNALAEQLESLTRPHS